jgi:iron(III) transport system substrate-binding protein
MKLRGSRPLPPLLTFALLGVAIAGCSGGASPSAASPSPAPSASPQPSSAQASASPSPDTSALDEACAAGATEGTINVWDGFDTWETIDAAFMDAYPDIEIVHTESFDSRTAPALLTEHEAGRPPSADVFTSSTSTLPSLIEAGVYDPSAIDWEALGISTDVINEDMNAPMHDRGALGINYNPNTHQPADLPSTWDEILDEKWAGQVVVDPRGRPFDALSVAWGHDATIDYVEKLAANQPIPIQGATAGMQAVATGQGVFSTSGHSRDTAGEASRGAPIAIKYLDVVPVNQSFTVIPAGAAHPNAAMCYVAWIVGPEGQSVYFESEFGSNSLSSDIPNSSEVLEVESGEDAEQVASISAEIGAILTGTQ